MAKGEDELSVARELDRFDIGRSCVQCNQLLSGFEVPYAHRWVVGAKNVIIAGAGYDAFFIGTEADSVNCRAMAQEFMKEPAGFHVPKLGDIRRVLGCGSGCREQAGFIVVEFGGVEMAVGEEL